MLLGIREICKSMDKFVNRNRISRKLFNKLAPIHAVREEGRSSGVVAREAWSKRRGATRRGFLLNPWNQNSRGRESIPWKGAVCSRVSGASTPGINFLDSARP